MAERTFETHRELRAKKLFCEDYSSSSADDNAWDLEPPKNNLSVENY